MQLVILDFLQFMEEGLHTSLHPLGCMQKLRLRNEE